MASSQPRVTMGEREFTAFLALSMALAAFGIDLLLPALGSIRADLGLAPDSTAVAGLITAYIMGLAAGMLVYGPVSDRYGRRRSLYVGYGIYAAGAIASAVSPTLPPLLVARFVWGLGAAGPRSLTLAMVRDAYEGERMARAMSFVMAVFLLAPVLAPSAGAAIVSVGSWRWIALVSALAALGMSLWLLRVPETLHEDHELELRMGRVLRAARSVVSNRQTAGYTLAMTALYGVLISYVASSEIIFSETFGQADNYPYLFGTLAAVMGASMLLNARLVGRVGVWRLAHGTLIAYLLAAVGFVVLTVTTDGRPPLVAFMVAMAVMLASHSLMIPNLNTIAMMPMAQVAGTASSLIGAVQMAVGALLALVLDQSYDGTVRPLTFGFLAYGTIALVAVAWAEGGNLFPARAAPQPAPQWATTQD